MLTQLELFQHEVQDFIQVAYNHHKGENLAKGPHSLIWEDNYVVLLLIIAKMRWHHMLTKRLGHARSSVMVTETAVKILYQARDVSTRNAFTR